MRTVKKMVRCVVSVTKNFRVEGGLHQASALSPFLLAMVINSLADMVGQDSPWTMTFADDIVI